MFLGQRVKICIDQYSVLAYLESNFKTVRQILEKLNFELEPIDEYLDKTLSQSSLILIPAKVAFKLTVKEIKMILDALLRGANILIMLSEGGDCELTNNLQEVLEPLGIYIRCNKVTDLNGNSKLKIEPTKHHQILDDVYDVYYVEGCSFMVKKRATTEIVLEAPKNSNTGVVPLIVAARYGNGRLIVIGSYKMFDDDHIKHYSNARLFINIILWMLRKTVNTNVIESILTEVGISRVLAPTVPVSSTKIEMPKKMSREQKKPELLSRDELERIKQEVFESIEFVAPKKEKIVQQSLETPKTHVIEKESLEFERVIPSVTEQKPVKPPAVEEQFKQSVVEKKVEHLPTKHVKHEVSPRVPEPAYPPLPPQQPHPISQEVQPSSKETVAKFERPLEEYRRQIGHEFIEAEKPSEVEVRHIERPKTEHQEDVELLAREIVEIKDVIRTFLQDALEFNAKMIKVLSTLNEKLEKIEEKLNKITNR